MFLALAQLTNKAFTDAGKGRIRQSLTALVCYYRPTKTIAFHNTTKGGCLSGRIVIIILLMYNQILYDNKQPNDML